MSEYGNSHFNSISIGQ